MPSTPKEFMLCVNCTQLLLFNYVQQIYALPLHKPMLLLDFGNKLACTFSCDGSNVRLFLFELRPDLNKKDCPLVKRHKRTRQQIQ